MALVEQVVRPCESAEGRGRLRRCRRSSRGRGWRPHLAPGAGCPRSLEPILTARYSHVFDDEPARAAEQRDAAFDHVDNPSSSGRRSSRPCVGSTKAAVEISAKAPPLCLRNLRGLRRLRTASPRCARSSVCWETGLEPRVGEDVDRNVDATPGGILDTPSCSRRSRRSAQRILFDLPPGSSSRPRPARSNRRTGAVHPQLADRRPGRLGAGPADARHVVGAEGLEPPTEQHDGSRDRRDPAHRREASRSNLTDVTRTI